MAALLRNWARMNGPNSSLNRCLLQQVLDAVALFQELFQREVQALAREGVDFQAFDTLVFAVSVVTGTP